MGIARWDPLHVTTNLLSHQEVHPAEGAGFHR